MTDLKIELWAVTQTDLSGVTHVSVTSSRDEAVSHFMHSVYLFKHAAPDENFVVVGDDYDAALTGLHLIWKSDDVSISVASVTRPASIGSNQGYVPFFTGEKSFFDLADEMNAAIALVHGKLDPEDVERLKFSSAAMAMGRYLAEALIEPDESLEHKKVSQAKAKRMWTGMKDVDQYISMMAVVRG